MTRREIIALSLAFLITLPAVTSRLYASDEVQYYAWLRSLVFDHDADFENEYQHFYDAGVSRSPEFHETFLERQTPSGRRMNFTTLGSALLWAPFYAAGHVAALLSGAPTDGYSRPYILAVALGSAVYGFLAVLLSAAAARRVVGRGLAASLIVAVGTPLVFYSYVAPIFGHATSAFAVSLLVWVWLRVRDRWALPGALALGLAGGLVAIVREQDGLLAIGPAVDFLLFARDRLRTRDAGTVTTPRRLVAVAITGLAGFVLAFLPQAAAYASINGGVRPDATVVRKLTWTSPHALGVLFSPENGLLAWTPLVMIALAGLLLLAVNYAGISGMQRVGVLLLVMVAAQVYTSGSVQSWTVAGSFGQRRFVALTPVLTIGVATILTVTTHVWARRAVMAMLVLCVWWNAGLMVQFGMNRMDRQKLTLARNARLTFVEIPFEAPGIAWDYLTNRSSFYKRQRQ
jgi:hypothetical protein